MLHGCIRQHQRVLIHLVAEMVSNALQLHQAANKREAALLILYAVVPHPVAAGESVFHADMKLAQQGGDDVRHRLALENTQVAVTLHRPQIWLDGQLVLRVARAGQLYRTHASLSDFAVDIARRHRVLRRDGDGHRLAQQRAAIQTSIGAEHGQL